MPDPEDRLNSQEPARVSPVMPFIGFVILAIVGLVYFFIWHERPEPELEEVAEPIATATPQPTMPPPAVTPEPTATPVPEATPEPLPDLNSSDAPLRAELSKAGLDDWVIRITPEESVRKAVRAIYNLSKGQVVQQYRPVQGPDTAFAASATGDIVTIENPKKPGEKTETEVYRVNGKNNARYEVFINLLRALDHQVVLRLYERYYPLLQQAYGELGEGPASFHTVVLQACDSFLATPLPNEEPLLIRPSVHYEFLKPELRRLPATQKLLLRMGHHNRRLLLEELRGLRDTLAEADINSQ